MRKLCLRAEELRVESFPTLVPTANQRGTIRAHDSDESCGYCTDPTAYCWTDPTAERTWQPAFTCPECAPV